MLQNRFNLILKRVIHQNRFNYWLILAWTWLLIATQKRNMKHRMNTLELFTQLQPISNRTNLVQHYKWTNPTLLKLSTPRYTQMSSREQYPIPHTK